MIAGVALVLLAQAPDPAHLNGPIFSSPARMSHSAPLAFPARVSLEWPSPQAGFIDPTTDSRVVAVSGYGIADGGASWQWIGSNGQALAGTPTDPGTAKLVNTPLWGHKGYDITAASQAPSVVSTALDAIYNQNASTTRCFGYWRRLGVTGDMAWFTYAYPGGANGDYRMGVDRTGATMGSAGAWCEWNAPGPLSTQAMNDGWSAFGCRYDGVNSCANNSHASIDTNTVSQGSCATTRRDMLAGTSYIEGADNARTTPLNGVLLGCTRAGTSDGGTTGRFSDGDDGMLVDLFNQSYNRDQRLVVKQSTSLQGEVIDNVAVTGNIDAVWTPTPIVTTKGLRTYKHHENKWCPDPTDATSCTPIGGVSINKDVMCGPSSTMRAGVCECDQLVDNDAGVFMGVIGLEQISSAVPVPDDGGSRESHYINADFYLAAGLNDGGQGAGWTFDQATIIWTTNGTQTLNSCAFSGLPSDGTVKHVQCAPKFENPLDGGALSSAIPRIVVGTDAGQVGSVVVCLGNTNPGPYASSPWFSPDDGGSRPDTFYDIPPSGGLQDAGSWPSIADGGAYNLVYVPLFQGSAVSVQPTIGDPEYLLDVHNVANQDHTIVMVAGYPPSDGGSGDCSLLVGFRAGDGVHDTDFITPNQCETVGHAYAIRAEARGLGNGHCDDYVFRTDCGVPPVLAANDSATVAAWRASMHQFTSNCKAGNKRLIASDSTGTAYCPGSAAAPDHAYLCNRLTANVPGDCQILKLEVDAP